MFFTLTQAWNAPLQLRQHKSDHRAAFSANLCALSYRPASSQLLHQARQQALTVAEISAAEKVKMVELQAVS